MNTPLLFRFFVTAGAVALAPCLWGESASNALKFREEMANAILRGDERGASALARLKVGTQRSGLGVTDDDADLGYAALDIGLRLIGAQRPDEAEKFLDLAEKSLTKLVQKTPDSDAAAKAQHLATLAFIRSSFFNRDAESKAALDAAESLQPDDPQVKQMRVRLGAGKGKFFNKAAPGRG